MVQLRKMVGCRIRVTGTVQGVGFRPFVWRLASSLGLSGFVRNTTSGVEIELEGSKAKIEEFLKLLKSKKPPAARIASLKVDFTAPKGFKGFKIEESGEDKKRRLVVPPDLAICRECLEELFDPANRRFRYPFISCTNCGPRFSIIEKLPYDRENTTMRIFKMCRDCLSEYTNPEDRRFHAEPIACPVCGPKIWLEENGKKLAEDDEALKKAARAVVEGKILALKGLGGFHLICLAENEFAVSCLRERKKRWEKPFAVMFPDEKSLFSFCYVDPPELSQLRSPEAPIVLLKTKKNLASSVSPGLKTVGAFLPYTPLHALLLSEIGRPVVATSGNISDEPIAAENEEARKRLKGLADLFLMHNRPIRRRCDDSVCFFTAGRRIPVRRSRGFVPLPIPLSRPFRGVVLCLGAHLKNAVALAVSDAVYLSQHIGDLETEETRKFFEQTIFDMINLLGVKPDLVVMDKHPGYHRFFSVERLFPEAKILRVQHHVAHVLSVAAEKEVLPPFIGFAFDGLGYGDDKNIWGGEVFLITQRGYKRLMSLRPFTLFGGDRPARNPFMSAVGVCHAIGADLPASFIKRLGERKVKACLEALEKGIGTYTTTSCGRLFDAASSLAGIKDFSGYEGQAAVMFEHIGWDIAAGGCYKFAVKENVIDWASAFSELIKDVEKGVPAELISAKFHKGLAEAVFEAARLLTRRYSVKKLVFSGGVFQNRLLLGALLTMLENEGFEVYVNEEVPVNDGGIALGQAYAVWLWGEQCV